MSDQRKSRFPVKLALLTAIAAGSYIHGFRLCDISETPSSHRPWNVMLSGQVGGEETSHSKADGDWLSQLTK